MEFKNYPKLIVQILLLWIITFQTAIAIPQAQFLKDITSGSVYDHSQRDKKLFNLNGTLIYQPQGYELWQSDGTAGGTKKIPDNSPLQGNSFFVSSNNTYYQISSIPVSDEIKTYKLSVVDITTGNKTVLLSKNTGLSSVGSNGRGGKIHISPFIGLTNINGSVLFFIRDTNVDTNNNYNHELWETNGTLAGTTLIKKLPSTNASQIAPLIEINDTAIFAINREIWKSDGTATGTVKIEKNSSDPIFNYQRTGTIKTPFFKINKKVFFVTSKSSETEMRISSLWQSDGTKVGTSSLLTVSYRSNRGRLVPFSKFTNSSSNGSLYFVINGTDGQNGVWQSNGSIEGTKMMGGNFYDDNLVDVNGSLFYKGYTEEYGRELWKSEGISTENTMLTDIYPGIIGNLTKVKNTLFFTAKDGEHGNELWKSDGTVAGTTVVKDINPGTADANPILLGSVDNHLFFTANDGTGIWDLWQTDGTKAGTQLVHGSTGTGFVYIETIDNKLFFTTTNANSGRDLWVINNDSVEANPPVCESGLDPQTIKAGEGTALWWWSQNATTGSINNGIGDVTVPSNYKWIYPTETTTYTLTVKSANATTITCETTLVVDGNKSILPVCEMGADPQTIPAGEGTALWWWSDNAASAAIDKGIGSVTVPSDYKWFYPTETATYTMTAIGKNGETVNCATTIEVTQ